MKRASNAPSDLQVKVATLCGVSLDGLNKRAAAAVLGAALAEDVLGVVPNNPATDAQRAIADQLGISGLSAFKEIAAVQIKAAFVKLNEEAMKKHQFAPGMEVVFMGGPHVYELSHGVGEIFRISKVGKDGRLYFKHTNGAGAYPSQVEPCPTNASSRPSAPPARTAA